MALNMEALRAKLQKLNKKGTSSDLRWKPPEGKSTIRIVPLKTDPTMPFIEELVHYLGDKTYVSPITYGGRDPIEEFYEELKKDSYDQAKEFKAKPRTSLLIVVRGEESKGVRLWSFTPKVYKQIIEIMDTEDIGDITDVKTGRDLVISMTPKDKTGTGYSAVSVIYKPGTSPLSTDKELLNKWTTDQPDIKGLNAVLSYAELKSVLEKYLDPSTETPEQDSTTTTDDSPSAGESVVAETKKPKTSSIVDEFNELFDQ